MQDEAVPHLITSLNVSASHTSLAGVCASFNARIEALLRKSASSEIELRVQEQTRISLNVVSEALKRYDLSSLSLSYNGGKDCLVLLILFLSSLHVHVTAKELSVPSSIPAIYAYPPDPFPAVTSFVEDSSRKYHLDLAHIPTNPRLGYVGSISASNEQSGNNSHRKITIRDAFEAYLRPRPHIRAIFVGTRRTDPHGERLTFFDPTDHGWPDFMRIHPVIDWKLAEIWAFLRSDEIRGNFVSHDPSPMASPNAQRRNDSAYGAGVEYCHLYDMGYTSLGGQGDTLPNPKLRRPDGSYRPAYELIEDGEERLGRERVAKVT